MKRDASHGGHRKYLYEYKLEFQIDCMETSNPTRFGTTRVLGDYKEFVFNTPPHS
jgi:hypothetical protein